MNADVVTGVSSSPVLVLAAWLLTYAVHSTLLTAGVWLLDSRFPALSGSLKDLLWKVALLGGVITATLQIGLGHQPFGGQLALRAPSSTEQTTARTGQADDVRPGNAATPALSTTAMTPIAAGASSPATSRPAATAARKTTLSTVPSGLQAEVAAAVDGPATRAATPFAMVLDGARSAARSLQAAVDPRLLVGIWLGGALFFLGRLLRARVRLHRSLGTRRLVVDAHLLHTLERLRRAAGWKRDISLTASLRVQSPMALSGSEIVLPERALIELDADEQESMLAHEVAHVARRDPMWLLVSGVVECLFFFQPLHRVGRRCFQETTEYLCDAWAVRQTGHRLTLARCLARVAGWLERPHALPLACMARLGSPLIRRVQRLLEESRMDRSHLTLRGRTAAVLLPLALIAWLAPGVTTDATAGDDGPRTSRFHFSDDDGRDLQIQSRGNVELAEDDGDILEVSPDGYFRVEEDADHMRRWLEVTSRDGRLQYHYRVNGRTVEFDDEGRKWLAGILEDQKKRRENREIARREMNAHRQEITALREEQRRAVTELRQQERELMSRSRERVREMSRAEREELEQERDLHRQAREEYRRSAERLRASDRADARGQAEIEYRRVVDQIRSEHRDAMESTRDAHRSAVEQQREARREYREAIEQLDENDDRSSRDDQRDVLRHEYESDMDAARKALREAEERQSEIDREAENRGLDARRAYEDAVRGELALREDQARVMVEERQRAAEAYQESVRQLQESRTERQRDLQDEHRVEAEQLQDELRTLRERQMELQREWQQRMEDEREQLQRRLEDEGVDIDVMLPALAPIPPLAPMAPLMTSAVVAPLPPLPDMSYPAVLAPAPPLPDTLPTPGASVVMPALEALPVLAAPIALPDLPPVLFTEPVIAPVPPVDPDGPRVRLRTRAPRARTRPAPSVVPTPATTPSAEAAPAPSSAPTPEDEPI